MVQLSSQVRDQLKILHQKVSAKQAMTGSAIIVDLPIGQLRHHDTERCLFVVGSAYSELIRKQRIIIQVIKEAQDELTYVFQNVKKYTKNELIKKVKEIIIEGEEEPKPVVKNVEKLDKVTESVPVYPPDSDPPQA